MPCAVVTLLPVITNLPFVGEVVPIPTRWLVSTVTAVTPALCNVSAVAAAEVRLLMVGVVMVGLVARTLLPVPVFVTLEMFLLASKANAVDAVKPVNVVVPLMLAVATLAVVMPAVVIVAVPITAVVMLAVVTLAVVTAMFVSVTLPLLTVTLASVILLSVVTVFPSWIAVLPNVMVVAKLLSRLDNGIDAVAVPKV